MIRLSEIFIDFADMIAIWFCTFLIAETVRTLTGNQRDFDYFLLIFMLFNIGLTIKFIIKTTITECDLKYLKEEIHNSKDNKPY